MLLPDSTADTRVHASVRAPAVLVAVLLAVVAADTDPSREKGDPNFQYGSAQAVVALLVLGLSFIVTVCCLILQQRLRRLEDNHDGALLDRKSVV